ncbi:hypothetical protein C5167_008517 [Papaver somniferum]|uniref:Uncharacterized protein n=1 Tax=Papaver somniferum TaxID=3469 RepID=A0A4Y7JVU6_PAPSO|nr:hypothetical protein C5167_008517 [Papaver somniferum]
MERRHFFIYSVLVDLVIARGGEHSFNHSGFIDHGHGRHLFGETPPSSLEMYMEMNLLDVSY